LVWDIYSAVRARMIYAGRISKSILEDMLSAGSASDAINYLRETQYYQYIRGVPIENQELLELSLYLGLYRSLSPLLSIVDRSYRSIAEHGLLLVESRVVFSILESLVMGITMPLDLKMLEGTRAGELYRLAVEERSLVKALDYLNVSEYKYFVDTYNILSKYIDPKGALAIALDLGISRGLSKIIEDYGTLSKLICPEIDFMVLQAAIRISKEKVREYIGAGELADIACSISRSEVEDLYSYREEEAILNILRKLYGSQLVQKDLETSLTNIKGYVRKYVRGYLEASMLSYPFDPSVVWAAIRIRVMDIEDIIAIINGKKVMASVDAIKKVLSVPL